MVHILDGSYSRISIQGTTLGKKKVNLKNFYYYFLPLFKEQTSENKSEKVK